MAEDTADLLHLSKHFDLSKGVFSKVPEERLIEGGTTLSFKSSRFAIVGHERTGHILVSYDGFDQVSFLFPMAKLIAKSKKIQQANKNANCDFLSGPHQTHFYRYLRSSNQNAQNLIQTRNSHDLCRRDYFRPTFVTRWAKISQKIKPFSNPPLITLSFNYSNEFCVNS